MPNSLYRDYAELRLSLSFQPLSKRSTFANATAFPGRDPELSFRFILAGFYSDYRTGNQNLPNRTFATGLDGGGFLCRKTLLEINHELSL